MLQLCRHGHRTDVCQHKVSVIPDPPIFIPLHSVGRRADSRYGTYIFFGALNLFIVLPGTYLLFPETKK